MPGEPARFFGSNRTSNIISAVAAVLSFVATFVSIGSCTVSRQQLDLARTEASKQGAFLQVDNAHVIIETGDADPEPQYFGGDRQAVEIPIDVWDSAAHRTIFALVTNTGRQEAELHFSIRTGDDDVPFNDEASLNATCSPFLRQAEYRRCPETLGPQRSLIVSVAISDKYLRQLYEPYRSRTLQLCVLAVDLQCADTRVKLPAAAFR